MMQGLLSTLGGKGTNFGSSPKPDPRLRPAMGGKAPPAFGSSPKPPPSGLLQQIKSGYQPGSSPKPSPAASPSYYTYGAQPQPAPFAAAPRPNSGGYPLAQPVPGGFPAPNNASGSPAGVLGQLGARIPGKPGMPLRRATGGPTGATGVLSQLPAMEGRGPDGAFRGPGSGRDDAIDAKVSDGEWIADAETVSLIGDGSSEEGIRRLEQMRKRLRAHKGAALARGKFSPDAKQPEQYLGE